MSYNAPLLLRLNPEKIIEFPMSLYTTLKTKLQLSNVCDGSCVAFKIKTTAPKNYLVRPSTGVIAPGGRQEVEIVLQPITQEPVSGQDRFLVQAAVIEGTSRDQQQQQLPRDYWTSVDKNNLQEQRMTVMFRKEEASSSSGAAGGTSGHQINSSETTMTESLGQHALGEGSSKATLASSFTAGGGGGGGVPTNTGHSDFITAPSGGGGGGGSNIIAPVAPSEYKTKYEELVQYCLSLEKKNTALQRDAEHIKKRLEELNFAKEDSGASSLGSSKAFGLELWHWFLIVVVVVIALKFWFHL